MVECEKATVLSYTKAKGLHNDGVNPPLLEQLHKDESIQNHETVHVRENGTEVCVALTLSAILSPQHIVTGVSAIVRDITQQKELERLRQELVSTVSHELRTPITSIREGISQVLDGIHGSINDDQREFLDIALREIDRLRRIINDLLEVGYDIVAVTRAATVEVQVFDLSGRLVRTLYDGGGLSGHYDQQTLPGLAWDGLRLRGSR